MGSRISGSSDLRYIPAPVFKKTYDDLVKLGKRHEKLEHLLERKDTTAALAKQQAKLIDFLKDASDKRYDKVSFYKELGSKVYLRVNDRKIIRIVEKGMGELPLSKEEQLRERRAKPPIGVVSQIVDLRNCLGQCNVLNAEFLTARARVEQLKTAVRAAAAKKMDGSFALVLLGGKGRAGAECLLVIDLYPPENAKA
jgi:hypothetical protein